MREETGIPAGIQNRCPPKSLSKTKASPATRSPGAAGRGFLTRVGRGVTRDGDSESLGMCFLQGWQGSSASSQKVGQAGAQARGDRFLRVEPELCVRNQRRRAGVLSVREPGPWLPAVGRVAAQIC